MRLLFTLLSTVLFVQLFSTGSFAAPDATDAAKPSKHIIDKDLAKIFQLAVPILEVPGKPKPNAGVTVKPEPLQAPSMVLTFAKMHPAYPSSGSKVDLFMSIKVNKDIENCDDVTFYNTVKLSNGQVISDLPEKMRTIPLCSFLNGHIMTAKAAETQAPLSSSKRIPARSEAYVFYFAVDLPKYIPPDTYILDTTARYAGQRESIFHVSGDFAVRRTEL